MCQIVEKMHSRLFSCLDSEVNSTATCRIGDPSSGKNMVFSFSNNNIMAYGKKKKLPQINSAEE